MFIPRSGAIVVTGASGWIGRTLLERLYALLPHDEFISRVRPFTSKSGSICLDSGLLIPAHPLTSLPEIVNKETCAFFLHAAFLTPDRYAILGHEAYAAINRSITKQVETALRSCSAARLVLFSSGAAALVETSQPQVSSAKLLYGSLKHEEEQRLQSLVPSLTLRIYALSGRYIREPRRYALGDIIYQALHSKCIQLSSPTRIVRGYVHADCLSEAALGWLFGCFFAAGNIINAVTHEVDLFELASSVAATYGGMPVLAPLAANTKPDLYSACPREFLRLLDLLRINVTSMERQIRDTALAFRGMSSSG
jgi:nucleoside-diphosphate-sugar epimerase